MTKRLFALIFLLLPFVVFSSGCSILARKEGPNLGEIYNRSASHQDLERNPIIVIPGILGSKLRDAETGRLAWGAFGGEAINPKKDADLRAFAHPMGLGKSFVELQDGIQPDGALDRIDIRTFFLPLRLNAYYFILTSLGVGGYRDQQLSEAGAVDYGEDHFTCFQFAYDWRRDISENAKLLHEFILQKKQYVQQEKEKRFGMGAEEVKFDIVAHSMGGLLARYYLRYGAQHIGQSGALPELNWKGAQYVDRAILVGTPNAGSAYALVQLVEGIKFAPFLPKYDAATLGTMPAVYQLLPRPRHHAVLALGTEKPIDIYDIEIWKQRSWGLASPKSAKTLKRLLPQVDNQQQREEIARDHLLKALNIAKRFHEALDKPAKTPKSLSINLFAGDAVQTASVLSVKPNGKIKILETAPGDGTVLRTSTLMDERLGKPWVPKVSTPIDWHNVMFLFTDHIGLTKDPSFTDNILYLLLEEPRAKF